MTAGKRRRRSSRNTLRSQVPLRTFADGQDPSPGFVEADLVAHCGGAMAGSFVWTLVVTDIASGWTDCAALLVREGRLVVEALDQLRKALPFPLLGIDTDNGSEFLHEMLVSYCSAEGIELTRSRPYRKNDQAWVEQKNGAVVRRLVGYGRLEGVAAGETLARLDSASRLFVNVFQPSFKLAEKTRDSARLGCDSRGEEGASRRAVEHLGPARAPGRDSYGATPARCPGCGRDGPSDAATRCRARPVPAQLGGGLASRGSAADTPARVVQWLEAEPQRTGKELFDRLRREHPGMFVPGQLRTLERRVRDWRRLEVRRLILADPLGSPAGAADSPGAVAEPLDRDPEPEVGSDGSDQFESAVLINRPGRDAAFTSVSTR